MDFDLCRELQKEAEKASFEVYSGEKLSPGKFGVMEYGTPKQRMVWCQICYMIGKMTGGGSILLPAGLSALMQKPV